MFTAAFIVTIVISLQNILRFKEKLSYMSKVKGGANGRTEAWVQPSVSLLPLQLEEQFCGTTPSSIIMTLEWLPALSSMVWIKSGMLMFYSVGRTKGMDMTSWVEHTAASTVSLYLAGYKNKAKGGREVDHSVKCLLQKHGDMSLNL